MYYINSYYDQGCDNSVLKIYSGVATTKTYNGISLSGTCVQDYFDEGLNTKAANLNYDIPLISDTGGILYSITYTFTEQTYGGYGDRGFLTVTGTGNLYTAEGALIGNSNAVTCKSAINDYATKTNSLNAAHDLLASSFSTSSDYVTLKIKLNFDGAGADLTTGGKLNGGVTCSQIVAKYKG